MDSSTIARGRAHMSSKEKKVTLYPHGEIETSIQTKDYFVFWEIVKKAEIKHCYMIGVNSRDKKKLNDVLVYLLGKNMLTNVFNGLDSSKLFTSSLRLRPLQKEIYQHFHDLKFILVALNRSDFPKQRYC